MTSIAETICVNFFVKFEAGIVTAMAFFDSIDKSQSIVFCVRVCRQQSLK